MRVHSNILTDEKIREALAHAQSNGRTGQTVFLDVLTEHGSRSRKAAFEVQIASTTCESFKAAGIDDEGYSPAAVKRASRRHVRRAGGPHYSPSWHEHGHFIAELFWIDPNAIVGMYDGQDSFEYQTDMNNRSSYAHDHAMDYNGRTYEFTYDAAIYHKNR